MTYQKWKLLVDEGYSSDVISFLSFIKNEEQIDEDHPKSKAILSLIERKELIKEGAITRLGEELLKNLNQIGTIPNKVAKSDKFEDWWKTYPATDGFAMDGKIFPGSQSKRVKKELCKKQFNKLVNNGLSADDIINATALHIEKAKKQSFVKGTSQLTYIANSERYLRESMFEPYIEMLKTTEKEPEYKSNIIE